MNKHRFIARLLLLSLVVSCTHSDDSAVRAPQSLDSESVNTSVSVFFGPNVAVPLKQRVTNLLQAGIPRFNQGSCSVTGEKHIDFYFGDHSENLVLDAEKNLLTSEGFAIKTKRKGNCLSVSVNAKSARGAGYGIYAVLQDIGYRFLHPLKPQSEYLNLDLDRLEKSTRSESPRWDVRSIHLHTMHPLELTNLLNGWGVSGPADAKGWNEMLPYWSLYLEWLTAHKQNEVEWVLLWAPVAGDFNQSAERQVRLKKLTTMAKAWGIEVGVVAPVRFVQQNTFTLLRNHKARKGKPNEQQDNINEILGNLRWLVDCGFTAVGGELGEGEFSSTPPAATLAESNAIADYLDRHTPKIPYRVKVHVSQHQVAKGYPDPMTGKDINFNYLPLYADANVGVMPHTVQIYSLDDPSPTYGATNFMDIFRFMKMAAGGAVKGLRREVLFYPETAYWVSYDVDVPLFLPVYPYRRVHDLRMIAQDEERGEMKRTGSHINGQVIFSSGWEFGYWFNDVISAEAAWNPRAEAATSAQAFEEIIKDVFRLEGAASQLADILSKVAKSQHELLVKGVVNGKPPAKIEKRTGIAYMSGIDVYDELPMWNLEHLPGSLKHSLPLTQPNKFREDWAFKKSHYLSEQKYKEELKPLLAAMAVTFKNDADSILTYAQSGLHRGLTLSLQDISDSARVTALRAEFVFNLYETRLAKFKQGTLTGKEPSYINLHSALRKALAITQLKKTTIPMQPAHRPLIAGWETAAAKNPTDYRYGYTWTSYNLYYWKRELNRMRIPDGDGRACFMNLVKPTEIVGQSSGPVPLINRISQATGLLKNCMNIPSSEPDVDKGW
jgi:glutathione S-transferase